MTVVNDERWCSNEDWVCQYTVPNVLVHEAKDEPALEAIVHSECLDDFLPDRSFD